MNTRKSDIESEKGKITHLRKVLQTIRLVNQLIIQEKNPRILARKICDGLVENRGYYDASIILTDSNEKLSFITGSLSDKNYKQLSEQISNGSWPYCCKDALNKKDLIILREPDKECKGCPLAYQYDDNGVFIIRLETEEHLYGFLMASIPKEFLYDEEEQYLFHELAVDISIAFNLYNLKEYHNKVRTELQKNEYFLNNLTEISPVGIVKTNANGDLDYLNKRAEIIFDFDKNDIIGKSSLFESIQFFNEQGEPMTYDELPFTKAQHAQKTLYNHQCGVYIQGEFKYLSVNVTPTFTNENTFDGVVAVIEDVTKMYEHQKETLNVKKELEDTLSGLPVHIFRYKKDTDNQLIVCFSEGAVPRHNSLDTLHVKGEYLQNIIGKENYESLKDRFYQAFNGDWVDYELHLSGRWYKTRLKPYKFDENDHVTEVIGYSNDITAQKEAELKLSEESQLRKLLMQLSADFINIPLADLDNAIYEALKKLGQFVGADRVYIFDYDFDHRVTSNTYEWCQEGIESQIDKLQNVSLDLVPDWINSHIQNKPVYIPDINQMPKNDLYEILSSQQIKSLLTIPIMKQDECIGFIGYDFVRDYHSVNEDAQELLKVFSQILVNLYERKEKERELNKFKTVADYASYGIGITDIEGKMMYVNHYFASLLGYTPENLQGKYLNEIHSKEMMSKINSLTEKLKDDHYIANEEIWVKDRNGNDIPFLMNSIFIKGDKNESSYAATTTIDISKQKEKEKELIKAKEKAEESDRLKSVFLANFSHEIRTPMNGILGFMGLLNNPDVTNFERKEFIRFIEESGKRMLETLDNLMEISKIETGNVKFKYENFDVNTLVDELYASLVPKAEEKNTAFVVKKANAGSPAMFFTDREKLHTVLKQLLQNAIKFTDNGRVYFGYSWQNGNIEFFIRDTGVGIAHDKLKSVFDRFIQADRSLSREYEGLGLGLAISKAYVEKLGGKIDVKSKINEGTHFYFTLPKQNSEESE
ncbi:MAG: PAS domain S-box protein [Bacteroidales bacterium]|nr:PAS domain S-box protein [Bacteroidales bacterium]MCF8328184.1 PAS domain S-box protein [Bacteroidales bacterium]